MGEPEHLIIDSATPAIFRDELPWKYWRQHGPEVSSLSRAQQGLVDAELAGYHSSFQGGCGDYDLSDPDEGRSVGRCEPWPKSVNYKGII